LAGSKLTKIFEENIKIPPGLMDKTTILLQLENRYARLIELIESLPEGRLEQAPEPGKWSTGQHAAHLVLSTRPLNKALRMSRAELKAAFGERGARAERDTETMIAVYRTALSQGLQAPARFTPGEITEAHKSGLLGDLRQELADLQDIIETWEESELSEYVIPHPALGPLTVREMLIFTVYHTEHHTRNAATP
jgi:uncharacterized damage-inducible protein DinB